MERVGLIICKDHVIICGDVLQSARHWARRGFAAEVLSFDTGRFPRPDLGDDGVRFRFLRTLYGHLRRRGRGGERERKSGPGGESPPSAPNPALRMAAAWFGALQTVEFVFFSTFHLLRRRYRLAIAFDTPSLVAARIALLLRGTPYVYHSRELILSADVKGIWRRIEKSIERSCHRHAAMTIIQDEARAGLLGRDNRIPAETFLPVPNAPAGEYGGGRSDVLRRRLALPPEAAIVLHAGSVSDETMVREIIESIPSWPPGAVLAVHGVVDNRYRSVLEKAVAPFASRIFLSSDVVPLAGVDELYASADVGLAFYRPIDHNFRYVGLAAGKIFNFLKVGVPVVVPDLPGMRELLEEPDCGRVVGDPSQAGLAIAELLEGREERRRRCLKLFGRYEFDRRYGEAAAKIEAAVNPSGGENA